MAVARNTPETKRSGRGRGARTAVRSEGSGRRASAGRRATKVVGGAVNGSAANGRSSNGRSSNGRSSNGKSSNGKSSNGKPSNGKPSNGRPSNGKAAAADADDVLALSSEELLRRWLESRDEGWRIVLVERHLPDVVETARCLSARLPRSVDVDDLCNAGYSGLLRCIETYDVSKGRSFLSYLRTRVYGAMVDELRAMDWLPRLMRSRLAQRDQLLERLRQDLGREPSEQEMAKGLGVSIETYRRSYPAVGSAVATSLVASSEQELDRLDASIVGLVSHGRAASESHPLTAMYHQELMERIQKILTTTEWKLVDLHYFKGLKLRDVAGRLNLSPARICQIHGRVLVRLKERLREEAPTI